MAGPGGVMYSLAAYNCATHILFAIATDVIGQNYFALKRSSGSGGFGLTTPSTGLVGDTSDNGTSVRIEVPDWAKHIAVGQLDLYRTPWGRAALAYLQAYGPSIVGLT